MRRMVLLAAVVSALLAVVLADMAGAARHRHRAAPACKRLAGKHPVAASRGIYVFSKANGNFYVCSGRGKVRLLPNQSGGLDDQLGTFVIAGTFLAWVDTSLIDPVAPVNDYVDVMNVKTGKLVVNSVLSWPPDVPMGNNETSVMALVLAPDGSVAWLAGLSAVGGASTGTSAVVLLPVGVAQSTLAQGMNISGLSATPDGTTVSWTQNGVPASSPLA